MYPDYYYEILPSHNQIKKTPEKSANTVNSLEEAERICIDYHKQRLNQNTFLKLALDAMLPYNHNHEIERYQGIAIFEWAEEHYPGFDFNTIQKPLTKTQANSYYVCD